MASLRLARFYASYDLSEKGLTSPLNDVLLEASRLLTARAAALYDANLDAGEASNIAKVCASDAASAALDAAIQAHGGNGMATEYGLSTLLGLVRLFRIAPVSTEMSLNHIARKSLGLPKSY